MDEKLKKQEKIWMWKGEKQGEIDSEKFIFELLMKEIEKNVQSHKEIEATGSQVYQSDDLSSILKERPTSLDELKTKLRRLGKNVLLKRTEIDINKVSEPVLELFDKWQKCQQIQGKTELQQTFTDISDFAQSLPRTAVNEHDGDFRAFINNSMSHEGERLAKMAIANKTKH